MSTITNLIVSLVPIAVYSIYCVTAVRTCCIVVKVLELNSL